DAQDVFDRLQPTERELRDDKGHWYLARVHPYRSNDERIEGVAVVIVDITDRKEAEQMRLELQRQEQAALAEKAIKRKEAEIARISRTLMVGEFATSLAHEVNQPLAGVLTNAAAALRWLDSESPDANEARTSLALIVRDGN